MQILSSLRIVCAALVVPTYSLQLNASFGDERPRHTAVESQSHQGVAAHEGRHAAVDSQTDQSVVARPAQNASVGSHSNRSVATRRGAVDQLIAASLARSAAAESKANHSVAAHRTQRSANQSQSNRSAAAHRTQHAAMASKFNGSAAHRAQHAAGHSKLNGSAADVGHKDSSVDDMLSELVSSAQLRDSAIPSLPSSQSSVRVQNDSAVSSLLSKHSALSKQASVRNSEAARAALSKHESLSHHVSHRVSKSARAKASNHASASKAAAKRTSVSTTADHASDRVSKSAKETASNHASVSKAAANRTSVSTTADHASHRVSKSAKATASNHASVSKAAANRTSVSAAAGKSHAEASGKSVKKRVRSTIRRRAIKTDSSKDALKEPQPAAKGTSKQEASETHGRLGKALKNATARAKTAASTVISKVGSIFQAPQIAQTEMHTIEEDGSKMQIVPQLPVASLAKSQAPLRIAEEDSRGMQLYREQALRNTTEEARDAASPAISKLGSIFQTRLPQASLHIADEGDRKVEKIEEIPAAAPASRQAPLRIAKQDDSGTQLVGDDEVSDTRKKRQSAKHEKQSTHSQKRSEKSSSGHRKEEVRQPKHSQKENVKKVDRQLQEAEEKKAAFNDTTLPSVGVLLDEPSSVYQSMTESIAKLKASLAHQEHAHWAVLTTHKAQYDAALAAVRQNTSNINNMSRLIESEVSLINKDNVRMRVKARVLENTGDKLRKQLRQLQENISNVQDFISGSLEAPLGDADQTRVLRQLEEKEAAHASELAHESAVAAVGGISLLQTSSHGGGEVDALRVEGLGYLMQLNTSLDNLDAEEDQSELTLKQSYEKEYAIEIERQQQALANLASLQARKQAAVELQSKLKKALKHVEDTVDNLKLKVTRLQAFVNLLSQA